MKFPSGPSLITMSTWVEYKKFLWWVEFEYNDSWYSNSTHERGHSTHETWVKLEYNLFFQTSLTLNIDKIPRNLCTHLRPSPGPSVRGCRDCWKSPRHWQNAHIRLLKDLTTSESHHWLDQPHQTQTLRTQEHSHHEILLRISSSFVATVEVTCLMRLVVETVLPR